MDAQLPSNLHAGNDGFVIDGSVFIVKHWLKIVYFVCAIIHWPTGCCFKRDWVNQCLQKLKPPPRNPPKTKNTNEKNVKQHSVFGSEMLLTKQLKTRCGCCRSHLVSVSCSFTQFVASSYTQNHERPSKPTYITLKKTPKTIKQHMIAPQGFANRRFQKSQPKHVVFSRRLQAPKKST